MKEVKSYISDDGIFSGSLEEVKRYEDDLAKRKEMDRSKADRKKVINDKIDEVTKLIDAYYNDYHQFPFENLNLFPLTLSDLLK